MPCTRMAIPLRFIATGEGNVGLQTNLEFLDNVPHLSYIYLNLNGGKSWEKLPRSELGLNQT